MNEQIDMKGLKCLEVAAHLHVPALDEFEDADWERVLRTKLEDFIGFQVVQIEVIDVSRAMEQIIRSIADSEDIPVQIHSFLDSFDAP